MQEIWKSFKLTDYDVSNLGNVLNRKTKRLLKPFLNDRYLVVVQSIRYVKVKLGVIINKLGKVLGRD